MSLLLVGLIGVAGYAIAFNGGLKTTITDFLNGIWRDANAAVEQAVEDVAPMIEPAVHTAEMQDSAIEEASSSELSLWQKILAWFSVGGYDGPPILYG